MYKGYNFHVKPVIQPLRKYAKEITEVAQMYLCTKIYPLLHYFFFFAALLLILKNGNNLNVQQ